MSQIASARDLDPRLLDSRKAELGSLSYRTSSMAAKPL
jgi:hypothetical protein